MNFGGGTGIKEIVTDNPHSGNNALYLKGSDWNPGVGGSALLHTIPLQSLGAIEVSFWFRDVFATSGPHQGNRGHVIAYLWDTPTTESVFNIQQTKGYVSDQVYGRIGQDETPIFSSVDLVGLAGWNKITLRYVKGDTSTFEAYLNEAQTPFISTSTTDPTNNVSSLGFAVGGAFNGYAEIYLDDVQITDLSAIPEPATLVLLGLGLFGLKRRKKLA